MSIKQDGTADSTEDPAGQTLPNGFAPAPVGESVQQTGLDQALVGKTLAKRYLVERLLGRGAMGVVYAVRHVRTGGTFAAKVLSRTWTSNTDIYERFRNEAKIVSQLRHPNIVQVTDFDEDEDGTPFMIMDLLEGETLDQRIQRLGRMPLSQALEVAEQVGDALRAAHAIGVVHRDIKPENIFLAQKQRAGVREEVPKVLDFGISKMRQTAMGRTQERTILGTPHFMSPEAALGEVREIDGRADQWALAVIMYLALSGSLPFDGINEMVVIFRLLNAEPVSLREMAPDLPPHVVRTIERGMAKKKDDRFATMDEFLDALLSSGGDRTEVRNMREVVAVGPVLTPPPVLTPASAPTPVVPTLVQTPIVEFKSARGTVVLAPTPPADAVRRTTAVTSLVGWTRGHRLHAAGMGLAAAGALVVALAAGHGRSDKVGQPAMKQAEVKSAAEPVKPPPQQAVRTDEVGAQPAMPAPVAGPSPAVRVNFRPKYPKMITLSCTGKKRQVKECDDRGCWLMLSPGWTCTASSPGYKASQYRQRDVRADGISIELRSDKLL